MPSGNSPILQQPLLAQNDTNKFTIVNNAIVRLEDAINRATTISLAAGNVTLTETQLLQFGIHIYTGATAARTITLPTTVGTSPASPTNRTFIVLNSSGHSITITHGAGTTVVVPNGENRLIYADGTDVITVASAVATFAGLTDTPGSYASAANMIARVNDLQTALEFGGLLSSVPRNEVGTTYTTVLGDAQKQITMTNAAANVVTIPLNATVAYPIGTVLMVTQGGTGATSVAATGGVTINAVNGDLTLGGQHTSVFLVKGATDSWTLIKLGGSGGLTEFGLNQQTGTAYTVALSDARRQITMTNAATNTVTIPNNATVALPLGSFFYVTQSGTGATTLAAGAGVTLNALNGDLTVGGQHASVLLIQTLTDVWTVVKGGAGGFTELGINTQTGTAYTLVLADARNQVIATNAAANTVTIPANASVAFPVGSFLYVTQGGSGETTLVADSGVTLDALNGNLSLGGENGTAMLVKSAADNWTVFKGGSGSGGGGSGASFVPTPIERAANTATAASFIEARIPTAGQFGMTAAEVAAQEIQFQNLTFSADNTLDIQAILEDGTVLTSASYDRLENANIGGTISGTPSIQSSITVGSVGSAAGEGLSIMIKSLDENGTQARKRFHHIFRRTQSNGTTKQYVSGSLEVVTSQRIIGWRATPQTGTVTGTARLTATKIGGDAIGNAAALASSLLPLTSQVLTTTGTYTTPSNCVAIKVIATGGGGAGGHVSDSNDKGAGGGQGGATVVKWIVNPNATYAYTIGAGGVPASNTAADLTLGGAGGDTDFGGVSFCFAVGGAGGQGRNGTLNLVGSAGFTDQTVGSIGDIVYPGTPGQGGVIEAGLSWNKGGSGGGAGLLGGGTPDTNGGQAGTAATTPGSGGSGANGVSVSLSGGAGAAGQIIVEEYYTSATALSAATTLITDRTVASVLSPNITFTNLNYDTVEFIFDSLDKVGTYRVYYQVSTDNGVTWLPTTYRSQRINQNSQDSATGDSFQVSFAYTTPSSGRATLTGLRSSSVVALDSRVSSGTSNNLVLGAGRCILSAPVNAVRLFDGENNAADFTAGNITVIGHIRQ